MSRGENIDSIQSIQLPNINVATAVEAVAAAVARCCYFIAAAVAKSPLPLLPLLSSVLPLPRQPVITNHPS